MAARLVEGRAVDRNRLTLAVILITVGVVLALDAMGVVSAGKLIADWWPLVFFVFAVVRLLSRPPDYTGAAVLGVIGLLILDGTADIWPGDIGSVLWPLLLIGAGVLVLLRRGRRPAGTSETGDTVQATVVFGGRKVTSTADPFQGGTAMALFGGIDVDLRAAVIGPDGAFFDATAAFGGISIIVPPGWDVRMSGPAIFGANEDKSQELGAPAPGAPRLTVRAFALFGGVDVKARPVEPALPLPVSSHAEVDAGGGPTQRK